MSTHPVVTIDALIWPLVDDFMRLRNADADAIAGHLASGDLAPVQRIGHNMKGNGAAYGFAELSRLGAALEIAGRDGDRDAVASLHTELVTYLDAVEIRRAE